MMNSPSMFSVEQLLKARQDGVPDYVVVPMLQKAMAERQAVAQQQALQQGMNQPPPVAQQILGAAQNSVVQDHLARRAQEEQPEARGIDSLRSGIDESDYAGGGIIAFAEGGSAYPEFDASAYENPYSDTDVDPVALREQYKSMVGTDPNIAKQEARIAERESRLKSEEDKAPWLALMQAGLATMAGTSPNALTNIGEGASKGLAAYGEAKERIGAKADKLDELRSKIEESQRAEALAAANYGMNSAEHRKQANTTAKLKGAEAKEMHIKNAMGYNIDKEKIAADLEAHRMAAGNSAAHLAETIRHNKAMEGGAGGIGGKPMTANHIADMLSNRLKELSGEEKEILASDELSPEEKEYALANIKGVRQGYQSQRLDVLRGHPVDIEYLTELEDVKNTPYSARLTPQPTAQTSNGGWSIRPR